MPDGLYERDALAWAERQASLLQRVAAGERVNALVDWENVIEEVRDVGLSELHACESLLVQALTHLLKIHRWPESPATRHWQAEVVAFLQDARRRYSPSMARRIDMTALFAQSRHRATIADGPGDGAILPSDCPWSLDELLADQPEPATLLARLRPI